MELKMKQRERYNNTEFLYVIHNHHFQYRTSIRNKLKKIQLQEDATRLQS